MALIEALCRHQSNKTKLVLYKLLVLHYNQQVKRQSASSKGGCDIRVSRCINKEVLLAIDKWFCLFGIVLLLKIFMNTKAVLSFKILLYALLYSP